jgi:hypothetical protein
VLEAVRAGRPSPDVAQAAARAYQLEGDWQRAAVSLMEGLVVAPNHAGLHAELAAVYRRLDPQGCALQGQGMEAAIDPACPLVRSHFCAAARNVARAYDRSRNPEAAGAVRRSASSGFGCPVAE